MTTKDLTPQQADQWVVQEFAKCPTPASVRERLASELNTERMAREYGLDAAFPNSARARRDLIQALREAAA